MRITLSLIKLLIFAANLSTAKSKKKIVKQLKNIAKLNPNNLLGLLLTKITAEQEPKPANQQHAQTNNSNLNYHSKKLKRLTMQFLANNTQCRVNKLVQVR